MTSGWLGGVLFTGQAVASGAGLCYGDSSVEAIHGRMSSTERGCGLKVALRFGEKLFHFSNRGQVYMAHRYAVIVTGKLLNRQLQLGFGALDLTHVKQCATTLDQETIDFGIVFD